MITDVRAVDATSAMSNIIKSCRDYMRKDKGLNGDVDRLPILVWLFFLKFLDDNEKLREAEAELGSTKYDALVEAPYRWRDWAAKEEGISGEELISFVASEEAVLPDGVRGKGLFAYLRSLKGISGFDQRDVIASIFRGINNRMVSGYILRDVVNKVNEIHLDQSDEVFALSHLYESLLLEMWDSAGDAGEFYTPRPLVRAIVKLMNPQFDETVLDPACGTGGFLVEAFSHMRNQCKTGSSLEALETSGIRGGEAKPMPFLLCQMNLLLHGVESPQIDSNNSLRFNLRDIGESDRVDVIMTNPPFGGEEEKGILSNFPEDKQTQETTLLFLQLIMRKLRRAGKPGRAAVVVPSGLLFGDGVYARVKLDLLADFNLHTILRLPHGVFAPYTTQETSVLFFDAEGPTSTIWFYEHPLPPARQALKHPCYTKSYPMVYEELMPLFDWWPNRVENEFAWKIDASTLADTNLDFHHPRRREGQPVQNPAALVDEIRDSSKSLQEALDRLVRLLDVTDRDDIDERYPLATLVDLGVIVNPETRNPGQNPDTDFVYVDIGAVSFNRIEDPKVLKGINAPSRARRAIKENDVLLSTVRPYLCGHAVVPDWLNDQVASTGFSVLRCPNSVHPLYVYYCLISPQLVAQYLGCMRGAHYPALKDSHVRSLRIPAAPEPEQRAIANRLSALERAIVPQSVEIFAYGNRILAEASRAASVMIADALAAISAEREPTLLSPLSIGFADDGEDLISTPYEADSALVKERAP